MDFEAKAREVLTGGVRGASASPPLIRAVADALRAAALDEGAREAARAELTRLLADVRGRALNPPFTVSVDPGAAAPWDAPTQPTPQADMEAMLSAAVFNAGTALTTPPQSALARLLERLLWLLGLSEGERRFVAALADDWAGDFDGLSVFADWLEDQGRPEDGIRVRRLVPRDGDVIVVRHPPGPRHKAHCATVQQMLDALAARGVRVWAVTMSDDMSLETAPPEAMHAAGWVRAEDANRAQLERAALELEDAAVADAPGVTLALLRSWLRARAAQLRHLAAGD